MLGLVCTGLAWITLQPTLAVLFDAVDQGLVMPADHLKRVRAVLPFLLTLDALGASALIFLVLYFGIAAPLLRAEAAIDQLSREGVSVELPAAGPLVARLQQALRRLATALSAESERSRAQLQELKRSNEELVRLQAELVASDRLATVGKLAAGVAHEVGNPLSGILGYLSVLRMRAKGQRELEDLAERMEAEVQRIDRIVRSLLELGRPSRGGAQLVDVRPLVDSAAHLLSAGQDFENVTVEVQCPESLFLRAEEGPLSQVLVNLLLNAAQAMKGGGRIVVRAGVEGERGTIAVEDEGPGLPPEVLSRLFEPFYTTKPAGKGTGLGLAVSRHLLGQFGGELTARNNEGKGATFVVSLPAV